MSDNQSEAKRDIVDIMVDSQEYRTLVFHIASINPAERANLKAPKALERSWQVLVSGNNADYAVLNYYMRIGILK